MMSDATPLEGEDEEMDIYAALGLNTPVGKQETVATTGRINEPYDPLAAFMDDEDEDVPAPAFVPSHGISNETVESLIETLARDLLDHERLSASVSGGRINMESLTVQRDRDAYHLSLIIDMGGETIKPFATVLAVEDTWRPMAAPQGLHARWKPVYEALCKALTEALSRQGRPSSL